MFLRKSIYPKSIMDGLVTSFVFFIIPTIYFFELFMVLPKYYKHWSLIYNFHFCMGNFIMYNICSNLMALMLCDTSIKGRILPTALKPDWRFCTACEAIAPPRSWHCNTCKVCILKRDHHCTFTSCCIGNDNHRYFLMFIFYMFVATVYATYYNLFFVWEHLVIESWLTPLKLLFPLATLLMEWSEGQVYIFLVIIIILGGVFTGILLIYHVDLMLRSLITHEKRYKSKYDTGTINNIKLVLGEKWYLVWLSPWIQSDLPCDGVNWDNIISSKEQ